MMTTTNQYRKKTLALAMMTIMVISIGTITMIPNAYAADFSPSLKVAPSNNRPSDSPTNTQTATYIMEFTPATRAGIKTIEVEFDGYSAGGGSVDDVQLKVDRGIFRAAEATGAGDTVTIELKRAMLFRTTLTVEIELAGIVHPIVRPLNAAAFDVEITTFDRKGVAVDSGMTTVTLSYPQTVHGGTTVPDIGIGAFTGDIVADTIRAITSVTVGVGTLTITPDSITVTGGSMLTLSGDGNGVKVDDGFEVTGVATLSGGLDMKGGTITDSTGAVTIDDDAVVTGTLTVGTSITIDGSTDTISTSGATLTLDETTTDVTGTLTVDTIDDSGAGLVTIDADAKVTGTLQVGTSITIDGSTDTISSSGATVTVDDDLDVTGDLDVAFDLGVAGEIIAGDIIAAGGYKNSFVFTFTDLATATTETLLPVTFGDVTEVRLPYAGSIIAISAQFDAALAADETATCRVEASGGAAFDVTVNDAIGDSATQAVDTDTFAADETIHVECDTDAEMDADEDVLVVVVIEY